MLYTRILLAIIISLPFCIAHAESADALLKKMIQLTTTKSHMIEVDSIDKSTPDGNEFDSIAQSAISNCMPNFNYRLNQINNAMNSRLTIENYASVIPELISTMKKNENDVVRCGEKFGVLIAPYHETAGGTFLYSDWLKTSLQTLQELEFATKQRRQAINIPAEPSLLAQIIGGILYGAALSGGYGVNPNQTLVRPYIKSDGTYVRGHFRTYPNAYCSDNLNGCK